MDHLVLRCGEIAAGGGCVARAPDGRVVFVRHSLPGELVEARVTSETSSYVRADAVSVLEGSPDRVEPACAHAGPGRCGGCDWQHVSLQRQRQLKGRLVAEQLRRIAGLERDVLVEPLSDEDGLGWRSRVRFAVDAEGAVGFRRHRSHELERVERCLVASEAVERAGVEASSWRGAREVEVLAPTPSGGDEGPTPAGVVSVTASRRGASLSAPPPAEGFGLVVDRVAVHDPARARARVRGRTFRVSPGSFWQAHESAPEVLSSALLDGLAPRRGERVLELFAGVGLFAALLGEAVGPRGRVLAVERDPVSCSDARHNVRHLPQVEIVEAAASPELLDGASYDLVVLDPPRRGAGAALVSAIAAARPLPRRVAYVACDPASFARDLDVACRAGWSLASLRAFDQFPMTEHVELLAVLEPGRR